MFTAMGFHMGSLNSAYCLAYAAIRRPLKPHVGSATEEKGRRADTDDTT